MPRPRPTEPEPSVVVNDKFRASIGENSITIHPVDTSAYGNLVEIGLGDATFVIDPADPPEIVERYLSGDSIGTFTKPIVFNNTRVTKTFETATTQNETFIDIDGSEVQIEALKLDGYEEYEAEADFTVSGFKNSANGQRILW